MKAAFKEYLNNIILCLFELVVGIFLLVDAFKFIAGVFILTGLALVVLGIVYVVKYFKEDPEPAARSLMFTIGLIALAAGAFFVFRYEFLAIALPVPTIIYGVIIFAIGLGKVQEAVDMLRLKKDKWFLHAVSAALSLICAVVIINNPFASTDVLWMFTGITLLFEAVFDVVTLVLTYEKKGDKDKDEPATTD